MSNKKTKEKISKVTYGVLSSIIDYVLVSLRVLGELSNIPPGGYTMSNVQRVISDAALGIDRKEVKNALYRVKSHGWIKNDLRLTLEGKKRLKNVLPHFLPKKKWHRSWYLVIFDIPEKLHWKRDAFREKLKELGFGKLQQSVWISAINYLPLLEKIVFDYGLESYVIFAKTDKIGRENAKEFAEEIWHLKKINREYQKFILSWQKVKNKKEIILLGMEYLQILGKDPQLPEELLPENWAGDKAHQLIKNSKLSQLIKI